VLSVASYLWIVIDVAFAVLNIVIAVAVLYDQLRMHARARTCTHTNTIASARSHHSNTIGRWNGIHLLAYAASVGTYSTNTLGY
jgi:hypothetical protein